MSLVAREDKELARLLNHMQAVRDHFWQVAEIKHAIESEDWFYFCQLWDEIPQEAQRSLWHATTKGGVWTIKERAEMRKYWSMRAEVTE